MRNLMTTSRHHLRFIAFGLALLVTGALCLAGAGQVLAQTAPKPGEVQSGPLPPPSGAPAAPSEAPSTPQPAPAAPQAQAPAPAPAPASPALQQSAAAANATLGPPPADPGTPDELMIAPKAEAFVEGEASWDDALTTIREAQKKVKDALDAAGVKIAGRPLTRFVKTADDKFNYEIGYPIEPPGAQPSLPSEVKLGTTPSGPAVRFTHHGAYDDIDGTYEAITVDLDAKGIEVNDAFLEEYLNDVADSSNADLEVYIYVFKK
ncbi:MAG: GyrI-like domain-containing protein [Hyphomicrobiales bacterium]